MCWNFQWHFQHNEHITCTNVSQTLACIQLAWGICCGNTVFDSTDLRRASSPHVMLTLLVQCHCDRIWAHLEDKLPGHLSWIVLIKVTFWPCLWGNILIKENEVERSMIKWVTPFCGVGSWMTITTTKS